MAENEITAAVREAKRKPVKKLAKSSRWPLAAIGVGIGSAAVVAALLFASRQRQRDKDQE